MPIDGASSSPTEEELRLAVLVVRLAGSVKQTVRTIGDGYGLSLAQLELLRQLWADGPSPMSRLAEALNCEASNLTGLVDKLETRYLVERQPDPADRRVRVLVLTELGAKVTREALLAFAQEYPLSHLPPDEVFHLAQVLGAALGKENPEIP